MITRDGRLKVADFGIASSLSETMAHISVRNDSSGTPPFMSPQQAMGERPAIGDDIYSIGATLYDLLTGKPPFYRGNIIAQVLQEPAESMTARRKELEVQGRPDVSPQWERMVAACLAKMPTDRPPSGAALLELLHTPLHALIPYAHREVIPFESLRLDVLQSKESAVQEAEIVAEDERPVEIRPMRRYRTEYEEPKAPGFFTILFQEVTAGLQRLFFLAFIATLIFGVCFLVHKWINLNPEPDAYVRIQGGQMQPVRVEVRYVGPAPQMPPPPPPMVMMMPPPHMPPPHMPPPPPPRR